MFHLFPSLTFNRHLAHSMGNTLYQKSFNMSTLPSTPGAGPSCPSRPRLWPVITAPMQPCTEDEDLEIVALTKKISALREKRAREEEER